MVVLSVTRCPPQLRGDLTKWFIEIDIGVYVGKVSARVREKVWSRVCDNIKKGKAIMVYSTNSEQGFQILTHNTSWIPVDCEGIWLMQKMSPAKESASYDWLAQEGSKSERDVKCIQKGKITNKQYIILDLETTGLDYASDKIIEIGMIKMEGGRIIDQYQNFILTGIDIPASIVALTGITRKMIEEKGITELDALEDMKKFVGEETVIGYNIEFDIKFINEMCSRNDYDKFIFKSKDALRLIRRKMRLDNYKLETVARACGIENCDGHRALADCQMLYRINDELNIF